MKMGGARGEEIKQRMGRSEDSEFSELAISQVVKYGYSRKYLIRMLEGDEYCHACACYYNLAKDLK